MKCKTKWEMKWVKKKWAQEKKHENEVSEGQEKDEKDDDFPQYMCSTVQYNTIEYSEYSTVQFIL